MLGSNAVVINDRQAGSFARLTRRATQGAGGNAQPAAPILLVLVLLCCGKIDLLASITVLHCIRRLREGSSRRTGGVGASGCPFTWYHQHNIGHHSYPNVDHRDPDLVHYFWLKREHKSVEWRTTHKMQRDTWFLIFWWTSAVEFGLATMNDFWMLIYRVYNDSVPMKVISRTRFLCHVAGRILTVGGIHFWPFFVLEASWTRKMIVHHLFPTVNHHHLVKLQPIVARLCEKHGVEYKHVAGYAAAIKAHHAHTVRMSYKENEHS
ncbi:hypothetical protein R1flu_007245 [Riccia fluitans]|uniref:Fatty acid desaturase domain-containing protein n=1 Tax=Riccia fluitans TaxID=41844 RepID=A0ABD1YYW1_9MARC